MIGQNVTKNMEKIDVILPVCLSIDDCPVLDPFKDSRAYELGYRAPKGPTTFAITYSKFGNEIFKFPSGGYKAPTGAVRSNYAEYKNFIDNPDPANDFLDALVPQKLKDPLIQKLVPEINPPFFNPVNDSAINPQPFIDFNPEKKDFKLPVLLTLGIIGFLILK